MKSNITYHKNCNILDVAESIVLAKQGGSSVIIPHICNNKGIFTGGLSNILSAKYQSSKINFEVGGPQPLGKTQFIKVLSGPNDQAMIISNLIVLDGIPNNRNYRYFKYQGLIQCLSSISSYINKQKDLQIGNPYQIHLSEKDLPLSKSEIKVIIDIIEDFLQKTPIFIYQ